MLDSSARLLERLLKPRLSAAIENGGGRSARQYDFRPGRSPINALREATEAAMVTQRGSLCSLSHWILRLKKRDLVAV